jgi:transcriptional regulator with XRE-family HTH domain
MAVIVDPVLAGRFLFFREKYIGSQTRAAEICKTSQKKISEVERCLTSISLEMLHQLYKFKEAPLNPDWFFTGVGNPKRGEKEKEKNLITTLKSLQDNIDHNDAAIGRLNYLMEKIYNDYYGSELKISANKHIKSVQKTSKKQ